MGVEGDRHTGERACTHSFSNCNFMDRITEEKIKSAANVVDVISDFLTLRKRGVEYVCLCPFHADENLGNFSINPAKGVYKCFACGAGGDAIKFLMEYRDSKLTYPEALHYIAKKYSIPIPDDDWKGGERWQNIKPATPKQIIETKREMLIHPREDVAKLKDGLENNVFVMWLRSLPWTDEQRKRLEQVLWLYCVRHWPKDGRVVFWQIDNEGRPHGAKMMCYNPNGKRVKKEQDEERSRPRWLHNQEGFREHLDLDHHQFVASLFGMHLMNRYPEATINIVESEKTALFMTTTYGELDKNLWLACGGLEFLKLESLQPLIDSGRRVWIWPDKDGVEKWRAKVGHLCDDRFNIYTRFFDRYWIEADGKKADVCDVQLRLMMRPETLKQEPTPKNDHKDSNLGLIEWNTDEPFLDPLEATDPRIREWRDILRRKFNFNKKHNDTSRGIRGEVSEEQA